MSEKRAEKVMIVSGIVSGVRHLDANESVGSSRKSYVTLNILGAQLNFPIEFEIASKLVLYSEVVFEFDMNPRLVNGRNSPYCVFSPVNARIFEPK